MKQATTEEILADIKFVDAPPPKNHGRHGWVRKTVEVLQGSPGQWALVRSYPTSGQTGMTASFKKLGAEATSRKISDTEFHLYARVPR